MTMPCFLLRIIRLTSQTTHAEHGRPNCYHTEIMMRHNRKMYTLVVSVFALLTLFVFLPMSSKPIYIYDLLKMLKRQTATKSSLIYLNLSDCPPKPEYLPEYKAHCWYEKTDAKECSSPSKNENGTRFVCAANLHLVGVRKSGTTDFQKWMAHRSDIASKHRDIYMGKIECPMEFFQHCFKEDSAIKNGYFACGPGNLVMSRKIEVNDTHITLVSPMQYLGYMAMNTTKYFALLRNPTDRAISYLFHWHREKLIYTNMTHEEFTAEFVDRVIRDCLTDLKKCITDHDVTYCSYLTDGIDGDMNALLVHSLYVVYIQEAFKFIPKDQFLFVTTEEYSKNTTNITKTITEGFFELPDQLVKLPAAEKKIVNAGIKNPVLPSTQQLLDDFYEPYNRQLSQLLGDDKWLFSVTRTNHMLRMF
ncbi:carbohydrate sulfotransferase 15-like isoform X2 [Watersipora subatra]|uniref:carbohydrate sulfotransferase 15-like isoform X2 n=1 Tax=Watersipora subatra TaxID=2589382 RepID=UPI00355C0C83